MASFNFQFRTASDRIREIYLNEVLIPVNNATVNKLREEIDENMYRAYSPVVYERTGMFMKSIKNEVRQNNDKMESLVYFDRAMLLHEREGKRVYVPLLVQLNEPQRNDNAWRPGAKKDTSFYAQTSLEMTRSYDLTRGWLRGRKIIY